MKITFIRHSKTKVDPRLPPPLWGLSEEGIELAKKLGTRDVIKRISLFYSSLQTKALETAILLAKPDAIPIKTDDRLTEVTSFTNKFIPEIKVYEKSVKDYYSGAIERINEGETIQEALDRFDKAIESIVETNNKEENIGIVSHGNILAFFSAQFKDIDPYPAHKEIRQPDVALFDWDKQKFIHFFGEMEILA